MKKEDKEIKEINLGIMGGSEVGKTVILDVFSGDEFREDMMITIGTKCLKKKIQLENGREIRLILWDSAGAQRFSSTGFKTLAQHNAKGIVLVFDVTRKDSFDDINWWLEEIKDNFPNISLFLLGNKIDLEKNKWQVTQEEIDNFVKQKNIKYFATSAKTNKGIDESFSYLANKIITDIQLKEKYPEENNDEKIKKLLLNELNLYKNVYDKLQKDYDELKNNNDKLKDDNDKLNKELNKAKYTIFILKIKLKKILMK